jgi:hypothetical protein
MPADTHRSIVRSVNARSFTRLQSPYLGVVGVVTAVSVIGYIRLLGQQGDWPGIGARQALVVILLAGFAVVSAIGTFARPTSVRAAASAACAAGLLALGFLALFSIGLPLMLAGVVALIGWLNVLRADGGRDTLVVSAASAIAVIVILAGGFAATG